MNTVSAMGSLKGRISEAAQELYLREGVEGFSMRKVAEAVGVSAPAIYRHYKNKEDLLNEIVVAGLEILESYLRPALDGETPYQRLVDLTERYLDFAVEQPRYFDFAFLVPSRKMGGFADEIAKGNWVTFQMAVAQVQACMEDGTFRKENPLETAITIWAEVHGLVTLYRAGGFWVQEAMFRNIFRQSVERVLRGLRPVPGEDE